MPNKNKETPHFLVPLVILSVATAGLFVAYAMTASSDYQKIFYTSASNAGSAVSGSVGTGTTGGGGSTPSTTTAPANKNFQVTDLKFDDKNGKLMLEWSASSNAGLSDVVEYIVKDSKNKPFTGANVYTNSVGTFSKPAAKKTTGGKDYYLAEVPAQVSANSGAKASAPIVPSAGSTTVSYEIGSLLPDKVYTFYVKSRLNGETEAYSSHAVLFYSNDYIVTAALPFKDVKEADWFHSYVSFLFYKGVIDKADFYNPTKELNRAETVKLVAKAISAQITDEDKKFAGQKFADVTENDWFAGYLGYMARRGWIKGVEKTPGVFEFKGSDGLTRSQMLKIISLAYGIDTSQYGKKLIFNDVPVGEWFAPYVEFAYSKGIISDSPGMLFYPGRTINRAEIAKILSVAMQKL